MNTRPTETRVRAFALTVICFLSWGLTTHGKFSATGDEPHYLMVTQSLWTDHDLDVSNNYASNGGVLFGGGGLEPEAHARPGRTGKLLPVHDIGVSFVLIPAYVAATRIATLPSDSVLQRFRMNRGLFAYSIISFCVIVLVVCAAAITITALEHSGLSERSATLIVTVLWLAPPVLSHSFLIFPEPFALLVTAWAVLEWTAPPQRWGFRHDAFAFVLGALPWLHRKYTFYAVAIFAITWWYRWRSIDASGGQWSVRAAALFLLPELAFMLWTCITGGIWQGRWRSTDCPSVCAASLKACRGCWSIARMACSGGRLCMRCCPPHGGCTAPKSACGCCQSPL